MGNALQINGLSISIGPGDTDPDGIAELNYGVAVSRASAVMGASPETLFTITGGRVLLTQFVGNVTVAIQAQATTWKIQNDPTGAQAAADICGTVDLNAKAIGTQIGVVGVPATAAQASTVVVGVLTSPILLQAGTIVGVYGAVSTGEIAYKLRYIPVDSGATVA